MDSLINKVHRLEMDYDELERRFDRLVAEIRSDRLKRTSENESSQETGQEGASERV